MSNSLHTGYRTRQLSKIQRQGYSYMNITFRYMYIGFINICTELLSYTKEPNYNKIIYKTIRFSQKDA